MGSMTWSSDLDTGIEVIDQQHRRILDYINELEDAHKGGHGKEAVGKVVDELVDYTLSHFSFEEALMEEAHYPFFKPHKKVHEIFTKRVSDFRTRFEMGEDVTEELHKLLTTWLINHIKRDDHDYVASVKANMEDHDEFVAKKKGFFARLFG